MKVLECSTAGDKRFSAFYAKVKLFGKWDTIENHYQSSKMFMVNGQMQQVDNPKGKKPTCVVVQNQFLDVKYLTPFYNLMWFMYLDNNPELVSYLSRFDSYHDRFVGKNTLNSQAEAIRMYMQEDWQTCMDSIQPLLDATGLVYTKMAGKWTLCRKLYTLGYSSLRGYPDMMEALRRTVEKVNGIIIDVRLNPYSRFFDIFNQDNMMRSGIPYVHLKQLGNKNYFNHTKANPLPFVLADEQNGLRILKGILVHETRNPILFCSEQDPRNCHRRMIAQMLFESDSITHLVPKGWKPKD